MTTADTALGNIVACEGIPEGTIYILPRVTLIRYMNYQTGEVREHFNFNPKEAGVITNVKP